MHTFKHPHLPIPWNSGGSLYYFLCQWLMTVLVVRFAVGFANAGMLTLAVSLTNIFSVIAHFAVRRYQVSDTDGRFTDAEYGLHRAITCTLSAVTCLLFLLPNGYRGATLATVMTYLLLRLNEAFCDYLHGILQKHGRMDAVGKSYLLRGTLILVTFLPLLYLTQSVPLSLLATFATNLGSALLYDLVQVRRLYDRCALRKGALCALTCACLPLLWYNLAVTAIPSISRYFLERLHGIEALGIYGSATTVAAVVLTVILLLFPPLMGFFSKISQSQSRKKPLFFISTALLSFAVLTTSAMIACAFVGEPLLVLLMGERIRPHAYLLDAAILASCITGLIWFLGSLLTVLRAYRTMIGGAVVGVLTSVACSFVWIERLSFRGVTLTNITALSTVAAIYLLRCICYLAAKPQPSVPDEGK